MTTAPCFGGPLNGQIASCGGFDMVAVAARRPTVYSRADLPSSADEIRRVHYSLERLAAVTCNRDHEHDERCRWEAQAWVADGYPKHRVTDALNVILVMASIGWR